MVGGAGEARARPSRLDRRITVGQRRRQCESVTLRCRRSTCTRSKLRARLTLGFRFCSKLWEPCRNVGIPRSYDANVMAKPRTSHCSICGAEKIRLKSGASRCSSCHNRRGREYYHSSALRRHKDRCAYLLRRYGLTYDNLERILSEQGDSCAICRKHWTSCKSAKRARDENIFLHYLCVDHDHRRNTVRGLLCNACNTAIGLFEEEPVRFEAAVAYLRRGS